MLAVLAIGCTSADPASTPASTPEARAPSTATPAATSAATPAEPGATPVGGPASTNARRISGLFTEPAPRSDPDRRAAVGPRPSSPFAPWNGNDVVLFARATGEERNLGPGARAVFSPDGAHLAWAAGASFDFRELQVLDLASGVVTDLGPARWVQGWVDGRTLSVFLPGPPDPNARELVDVETGARRPAPRSTSAPPLQETARWRLEKTAAGPYPEWSSAYRLVDLAGALAPLEFEAFRALLSSDGTLFIAAPPAAPSGPPDSGVHIEYAAVNVFSVDPVSAVATFLASAEASAPNWPFDASPRYVAWTDNYCAFGSGDRERHTRVYDRRHATLTQLDQAFWLDLTPDGLLGVGEFGPSALIDLETLAYVFVLPEQAVDVAWSNDFRYAALGFHGGHGGYCG